MAALTTHPAGPLRTAPAPDPECSMKRPVRWAVSPLDFDAHLLADGDQPLDVVKARCGQLLPMIVDEHEHPPGRVCPYCVLIARADLDAPDRFSR